MNIKNVQMSGIEQANKIDPVLLTMKGIESKLDLYLIKENSIFSIVECTAQAQEFLIIIFVFNLRFFF